MDKTSDKLIETYQETMESYHQQKSYCEQNISQICRLDDPRVPELIINSLSDSNPYLRHATCSGLVTRHEYVSDVQWKIETTHYMPILKERLRSGNILSAHGAFIDAIGLAMARVGGLAEIDTLIASLTHSSSDVRASVRAGILMLLHNDEASIPIVMKMLNSSNVHKRVEAAHVLCLFNEKFRSSCVEQLIDGLQFTEHRGFFVRLLGDIGDVNGASHLIPLLSDTSGGSIYYDHPIRVKHEAQEALRKLGDKVVPILENALTHNDDEVRTMVVYTLARIGTLSANAIIQSLVDTNDSILRKARQKVMDGSMPEPWLKHVYPTYDNLYLG